jgi:hypothetical protein
MENSVPKSIYAGKFLLEFAEFSFKNESFEEAREYSDRASKILKKRINNLDDKI